MFRKHFNVTTVIAIVALVFAMTGGAFAVTSKDNSQGSVASVAKKKEAKVLRGQRGPKGATGATGTTGPAGSTGPAGPTGPAGSQGAGGAKGENGAAGAAGTDGVSVTSSVEPKGSHCAEGGTKLVASNATTYACNGREGSPWTVNGTLPSGKTETGSWALGKVTKQEAEQAAPQIVVPISFPIPLAAGLAQDPNPASSHVHYVFAGGEELDETPGEEGFVPSTHCSGSAEAPTAQAGNLCIYLGHKEGGFFGTDGAFIQKAGGNGAGASTAGADVGFVVESEGAEAAGTWAVTAP